MINLTDYTFSVFNHSLSVVELLGVITSLAYTILAGYRKMACWIFGSLSSLIYLYISYQATFYQDTIIQFYYLAMAIWGWIAWQKEGIHTAQERPILRLRGRVLWVGALLLFAITALSGTVFMRYTNNAFPYADAFTTVFALAATWLQIKRYVESWIIFVAVDAVALCMYFSKGYALTAVLFGLYTCIAALLSIKWYRLWQHQNRTQLP